MLGIVIHCIQHSQAMLERGVCELAHSFFHLKYEIPKSYLLHLICLGKNERDYSFNTGTGQSMFSHASYTYSYLDNLHHSFTTEKVNEILFQSDKLFLHCDHEISFVRR